MPRSSTPTCSRIYSRRRHWPPSYTWIAACVAWNAAWSAPAATRNATSLTAEQFGPNAGLQPVPELARLLVEANEPRLWSLCAAVLRSVTGEDFGVFALAASTDARTALANRCRALFDSTRAAQAGR